MRKYTSLLLFLFVPFSSLHAQTDVITVPINKISARGDIGEFSFLSNGEFIRFARNGIQPGSQTIHEVTYPEASSTIISESWTFTGEKGPKGVYLTKKTMRVQDSLIERTVRTVGDILYREAVYTLDGNGRPVQLRLTQEKTADEARSYEVQLFDYVWNGTTEVEIKPQRTEEAHYRVQKKKRSLIIDKKIRKEVSVRTSLEYNKEGALNNVYKTGRPGSKISLVRRKDGSLRGAMKGSFSATTAGQPSKYIWGIKKNEELSALPEVAIKRITETIQEELILNELDYRLLFPKALDLF